MKKALLIFLTFAILFLLGSVVFFSYQKYQENLPTPFLPPENQNSLTSTPASVISTTTTPENKNTSTSSDTISNPGMKLYRNDQWGFEFWYPEGWEWKENIFRSPNSKFNLTLMKVDGQYTNQDTIINIVTPKFAEHIALTSHDTFKVGKIFIEGIESTKYSSVPGGPPEFIVDVPIDHYHILFGSAPWDEDKINSILSSFKFLK